jgi:hypothetical protein
MKKIKLLVLVAVLSCGIFYTARAIIFDEIPYAPGFVYWNVDGQHEGDPLELTLGQDLEMYICARAPFNVYRLRIEAKMTLLGATFDIPLPQQDYSGNIVNAELPLEMGRDLICRFTFVMPNYTYFAGLEGNLELVFYDGANVIAGGKTKVKINKR